MVNKNKIVQKKTNEPFIHATKGSSQFSLADNRPQAIIQQKQIEDLSNKNIKTPLQKKSNATGLPDNLKSGIENLSGHSMDDVKVHYNSSQPAQLNAHAYAQGTDIHIASGQEQHLPHEAWHVVQQKQGRVKPTLQMKGTVNVNDDAGLEKEADVMGARAISPTSSSAKKINTPVGQLKGKNTVQLNKNRYRNKHTKQSNKNQAKFQQQQQKKRNAPAPPKSTRTLKREEERAQSSRGSSRPFNPKLKWYHWFLILLYLSTLIPGADASPLPRTSGGKGRRSQEHDEGLDQFPGFHSGNTTSQVVSGSHNRTVVGHPSRFELSQYALVHAPQPITSSAFNTTFVPPQKESSVVGEAPRPTSLHVKNVVLGPTKPIGDEAGASKGLVADYVNFTDGRRWGKTFLKGSETNYNTDNSTVRASTYNSRFLKAMGVTIPEIETIKGDKDVISIASRDVGVYSHFKKISAELRKKPDFTPEQRADYVKLALLSPAADLHEKNFGLINGTHLGTIDVDTALPSHSHNYRRLIDRFKLEPGGYKTNDMSGSFLGDGRIQDNVFYKDIEIKEADVLKAVKSFCAIPVHELADQLHDYPLQGKASQKLALHSLRTQQLLFKEAFNDFKYKPSLETLWVDSTAYQLLNTTIEKFEKENRFPYSFQVVDKDNLKITVNEHFARKKGTGFWNDKEHSVTNPQLMKAAENGHLGDVNLRLTNKTNIVPADIPRLIELARPYLRSIGAGNQGVSFVVKLVHHPSFDKMDGSAKALVKKLFDDVAQSEKEGNPFRQALFPKGESRGGFKVDSFYKGGSEELRSAVEKIKRL